MGDLFFHILLEELTDVKWVIARVAVLYDDVIHYQSEPCKPIHSYVVMLGY